MRPRSWIAVSCCTLALATLSGAAGSMDSPAKPSAAVRREASALRHQLRVERVRAQRTFAAMRSSILTRSDVSEAIHLAAVSYGVDEGRMRAVIWRESRFRPWAHNPHSTACGLAQFLDSTWAGTPQGRAGMSCESAYANAMAMAWEVRYGAGWSPWAT